MSDQISIMEKDNVFDTRRIHFLLSDHYITWYALSKEKQNTPEDAAWKALQST